eukprot:CAMPEP_0197916254 /NCGR_PEP_ID=MMETSP1439-20131203/81653_1 /TAXON_ID=66791 /ORGANISM="Gonyaulax spinifera, Strain CCMP409" /LENGTH=112 /DNA_ID=CAMNT_0043538263 /DNA_START=34 /DNA_END=369 /DNA_ORIENTATION=-
MTVEVAGRLARPLVTQALPMYPLLALLESAGALLDADDVTVWLHPKLAAISPALTLALAKRSAVETLKPRSEMMMRKWSDSPPPCLPMMDLSPCVTAQIVVGRHGDGPSGRR